MICGFCSVSHLFLSIRKMKIHVECIDPSNIFVRQSTHLREEIHFWKHRIGLLLKNSVTWNGVFQQYGVISISMLKVFSTILIKQYESALRGKYSFESFCSDFDLCLSLISVLAISLSFDMKLPNGQSTRHPNVNQFIDSIRDRVIEAIRIYEKTPLGKTISFS